MNTTARITALWTASCVLAASLAASPSAFAGPKSAFTAEQLEKSVAGFCFDYETTLSDPKALISPDDLKIMAKEIADQIAYSEPERYNDIIGHMLAEYYHYPAHRTCLASLISSLFIPNELEAKSGKEAALARELKEYQVSPVTKVVDKVLFAFTVAYMFEFGRGVWKTRGSGLKGLELFGSKVKLVGEAYKTVGKYPWTMKAGVTAIGAGVGFAEVVYDSIQTKKADPRPLLIELQRDIIQAKARKVAESLAFLKRLNAVPAVELAKKADLNRGLIGQADLEITMIMEELAPIAEDAQFKADLEPLVEDMVAVRGLVADLNRKLGPGKSEAPTGRGFGSTDSDDDLIP